MNYFKDLSYFKEPLEQELITQLSFALQETRTTKHEFLLAISYILWSIDNRSWSGDNRAYLDWLLNFFGMMDAEEKRKFVNKYEDFGKRFGISKEKIKFMTAGADELEDSDNLPETSEDDESWSFEDSKYFAMSDEEKCDYLLECDDKLISSKVLLDLLEQMEGYFQNGSFAKIVRIANKIKNAKIDSKSREIIYSMKAEALICMKDYVNAEKAAQELIALNKNYPMGYFHIAPIKYYSNDLRGALGMLNKTIDVAEKNKMRHFQYYMIKAKVLKKLGDERYKDFQDIAIKLEKKNLLMIKKKAEKFGFDLKELGVVERKEDWI